MMTTARQVIALAVSVGICLGAAGIGSVLTLPSIATWYATLQKPHWTPPNWLFGPVWTVLYLSMAVAAWLIWRQLESHAVRLPLTLFVIQLALNVAWSGIFFHYRWVGLAFLEVVILWIFILSTTIAFGTVSRTASWLMVPYLVWVTYASALNAAIWRMNA
jgi:tryptophan-rich sensory protein